MNDEVILRIYCGETDKVNHELLYRVILLKAREMKLAGCTVFKGIAGFGMNSHLHTSQVLRLSEDLPVIIDIIDVVERIEEFKKYLDSILTDTKCSILMMQTAVKVKRYKNLSLQ